MAVRFCIALLCLLPLACGGDDDDGVADESEGEGEGSNTNGSTNGNTNGSTVGNTSAESGEPATDCDFDGSFDGTASSWPSPWENLGGTTSADVVDGRARLVPMTSNYSLGRMFVPMDCTDAEVSFKFEFTDASQGIGVYVRQNGGRLQATTPHGSGYAVFIENFRAPQGIGVWYEVDGVETLIQQVVSFPIELNVLYGGRVRVTQMSQGTTLLQARMWRDGDAEPTTWQVERTDSMPTLQNVGGGLAIDSYSSRTSGAAADLFIDDVVMRAAD